MNRQELLEQNQRFAHTNGVSDNNHDEGFHPAFRDVETGRIELARYPNGKIAPMHLISGLPKSWVVEFDEGGVPKTLKASVIAGFCRCGQFFTREQTIQACAEK